jgi:hypothetical protein
MSQPNQDPTQVVITRVKNIKSIELLKRFRRMYAGNGPVQSAIITRARELHEEAIAAASVKWDGQPLDV